MGKLKISKAKNKQKTRGTSGIPNWVLSVIAVITVLAVLGTCIGYLIGGTGLHLKLGTAISYDDDYKLDGKVMSYFLSETYNNYINQMYQTYYTYYTYGLTTDEFPTWMANNVGLNPSMSLNSQSYSMEGNDDVKTWKDYFIYSTVESVKQLLIYRAEAIKLGIELEDKDKQEIEDAIKDIIASVKESYPDLSDEACIAQRCGKNVKIADLRKALELQAIANKAAQQIGETIEDGITNDDINDAYNKNKDKFDNVDHITYSFGVSYTTVFEELFEEELKKDSSLKIENLSTDNKAKLNAKYQEKIEEARKKAAELAKSKTSDELLSWVLTNELYDDAFTSATSKLTDEQKPGEDVIDEVLKTTKSEMIKSIIKDLNAEKLDEKVYEEKKDGDKTTYTLYGNTVSKEFAEAAKTLKSNLYNSAEDLIIKGDSYIAPTGEGDEKEVDEFSEWAFADDRKVGDITTIEDGDCANGKKLDTTNMTERFTADVSLLTKTVYQDETASYDIAYMVFEDEATAKKAIELIQGTKDLNKEKFLELAEKEDTKAAGHQDADSYFEGDMQSDDFDKWLTAAKAGEYTKTPIKVDESYYVVAYANGAGELKAWQYEVKGSIYEERYTAREEEITKAYEGKITVHNWLINTISIGV